MKWSEVEIGQLCLTTDQADPRDNPGKPFEYIDISSVDKDFKVISQTQTIVGSEAPSRARKIVRKGDVLVSTVRPNLNTVAVVPESLDQQIASTGFCVLRPNAKYVVGKYLFYRTLTPDFISYLTARMRGANYPAVTDAVVRQAPIPWPPVREQHRIVEILDQADTLRKKRTEANRKAERILPALFYKMFGDPLSNSRGWDMHELGDLCSAITSGSRGWAIYAGNGNSLFVRTQDVLDGEISSTLLPIDPPSGAEANRTRLQDGDVVITITGVVGKAAVYRDCGRQAYVSQHVALVRTKSSLEPEYLTALANLPAGGTSILARLQYGQIKPGLGFRELRGVRIPLPPIEVQRKFTSIINKIRATKESTQTSRERLERLWSGLLHRAFSGDLTAKWRESHMKELLAEMEGQARALAARSDVNEASVVKASRHAGYDMYNKAALAAYIVHRCHEENQPLGRVKLAKLYYLAQSKAKIELTETFARRVAGPLDDEIFKFLSLAQKNRWVTLDANQGQLKPVRPGPDASKAAEQAAKVLGSTKPLVDEMLDQMKSWGHQTLERWATVLEAVQVIAGAGQPTNVEAVKDVIRKHPEWVPKLNRQEFADANIEATLRGLYKFGFVVNQS